MVLDIFFLSLNKIIGILNPILHLLQQKYFARFLSKPIRHQPVFIIGAPRTGSTILYQTITNQLDVLYFDNLICRLRNSPMIGFWLSEKVFEGRAHNSFRSYHGNTNNSGLRAPSECGQYWYRWLPTDKHYINSDDVSTRTIEHIRSEITSVTNCYNKPVVFKNLNAGQRMGLIQKCFPNAKFIIIKRDPLYTAQSIIKSKRRLGIPENEFWGIMPKNVEELRQLNSPEQIVKQIYYIERQIKKDKSLFPEDNFLHVNYSDMAHCFVETISNCEKFISANTRVGYKPAEINISENITLTQEEVEKINAEIQKLDWINYENE